MAGTTGLEPAASAVTGQRSNQLNYVPTRQINEMRNRRYLCGFARFALIARILRCSGVSVEGCFSNQTGQIDRRSDNQADLSTHLYPTSSS